METVAEFVETAEVAARLRELGVDFGQGYFFDRPRLLDEVLKDLSGCGAPVERTTRRRRVMSP
jgi:EAL domain-containing protein (putative c-di-GMP-specific phosphodiesterase class I)